MFFPLLANGSGLHNTRIPGVNFIDRNVKTSCNVLHSFVAFRDDAHTLGNGLGSDGMITSHHDNLQWNNKTTPNYLGMTVKGARVTSIRQIWESGNLP